MSLSIILYGKGMPFVRYSIPVSLTSLSVHQSIKPNILDDYRIFVGDLGNETNDEVLRKAFCKYPSFQKARVVRDKRSGKTKGYGFVSYSSPQDYSQAMKEMNGMIIFS